MKSIVFFNNIVVLVPIALAAFGIFNPVFLGIALLSTIITGFAQVVFAACYVADTPNDRNIYYYFAGVIMFFSLWFCGVDLEYIAWMPPVLAAYFTFILYNYSKVKKP